MGGERGNTREKGMGRGMRCGLLCIGRSFPQGSGRSLRIIYDVRYHVVRIYVVRTP